MKHFTRAVTLAVLLLTLAGCVVVPGGPWGPGHYYHNGGCGWYHNCWH